MFMPMATPKQHFKYGASTGISLVGVLVAAFVLAVGAIAISRLTSASERFTGVGREVTVASSLAREGLELVRAVRDNNWFQENTDSSHWLDHGLCATESDDISDTNRTIIIDPAMVRNISLGVQAGQPVSLGSGDPQLYVDNAGRWQHERAVTTPYKRSITLDCSTKNSEPKYITVTSTVTWSSRGQQREVVLAERLYNWLPERLKIKPTSP